MPSPGRWQAKSFPENWRSGVIITPPVSNRYLLPPPLSPVKHYPQSLLLLLPTPHPQHPPILITLSSPTKISAPQQIAPALLSRSFICRVYLKLHLALMDLVDAHPFWVYGRYACSLLRVHCISLHARTHACIPNRSKNGIMLPVYKLLT